MQFAVYLFGRPVLHVEFNQATEPEADDTEDEPDLRPDFRAIPGDSIHAGYTPQRMGFTLPSTDWEP